MRILYLANAPRARLTGAAIRTATFAAMAAEKGAHVTVAGPVGSALEAAVTERGVAFRALEFRLRDVARVHAMVREERPDVVHAMSAVPLVLARVRALTGRRSQEGPRLFVSIVVDPSSDRVFADGRRRPWSTRARNAVLVRVSSALDGIFPVSKAVRGSLEAMGVRGRMVVVGALTDVADLERRAAKPIDLPPGRPRICSAPGQLEALKGVDVLIRAFARLAQDHPEAVCLIAGEGAQRAELEALAAVQGVGDRVDLLGYLDEPAPFIAAADVFVSSSRTEGLSGVVVQALALGRPVVATAVGGVPEVVDDERTGLLVAADDEDALVAAMTRLVDDPGLAGRLAAAGKAEVAEHHNVHTAFATVWSEYERALGGGPR